MRFKSGLEQYVHREPTFGSRIELQYSDLPPYKPPVLPKRHAVTFYVHAHDAAAAVQRIVEGVKAHDEAMDLKVRFHYETKEI